ncbi:helix-turn-helix domain-containing protein [Halegenticoccus tardaugens]|uniref:helix-turn-helix domain-containing protein n=1 Tax=Halegenticoccus tardaugens TaxID=2071624 RepID=UPI00100B55BB|nr:helix-turn-helix domain-containing protein [Halegenticoccus tardaugens]
MSLIAEFHLGSPILRRALAETPDGVARAMDVQASECGAIRLFFWLRGADPDEFAAGVGADPTIREATELIEVADRRLYRVEYTEEGRGVSAYPAVVDVGAMNLDLKGTCEGWELRMRFPDRDALQTYRSRVLALGIELRLLAVYSEDAADEELPDESFGLTGPQQEVLSKAHAGGYFSIPREVTLGELAEQLGISTQAASVRLRRAHEALIENTIGV